MQTQSTFYSYPNAAYDNHQIPNQFNSMFSNQTLGYECSPSDINITNINPFCEIKHQNLQFTNNNLKYKNFTNSRKRSSKNIFTINEDKKLVELYSIYKDNWRKISASMSNRSERQCKERYFHYLAPNISTSQWSEEEDELLYQKVKEIGKRWKMLENYFPGRTEISIRNRWNMIERKEIKERKKAIKNIIHYNNKLIKATNHSPKNNPISYKQINTVKKSDTTNKSILTENNSYENNDIIQSPNLTALPNPFHENQNLSTNECDDKSTEKYPQNSIFNDDFTLEEILEIEFNFEKDFPQNFMT